MKRTSKIPKKCKQVISSNEAAGPHLPTYIVKAVSITQHIFCFDRLLGTMQLALASGFHVL